ncbi:MAG TPA: endonuclease/exonuclease/phosphatase family protein [Tepidiformaceae bacterium]|nr:endonuclease/exonuclease/phosphatase family protein [Tepidiformaceae bacterium]
MNVQRWRARAGGFGAVAAWWLAVTLAWGIYSRTFAQDGSIMAAWVSNLTYWFFLPAYPLAMIAIGLGWWRVLALAGVVVMFHLMWVSPTLRGGSAHAEVQGEGPELTVVSANVRTDNPSPDKWLAELTSLDADVIMIQEYTPTWAARFRQAGLFDKYPYSVEAPELGATGSAILSRLPLVTAESWNMDGTSNTRARLGDAWGGLELLNVHPVPPKPHADAQWENLIATVEQVQGPHLVAGDYNITQYNRWYDKLEDTGMQSCHDALGESGNTTWPNGVYPVPPMRFDNFFVSDEVACISLREGRGSGSDHEPLIVHIALKKATTQDRVELPAALP